MNCVIIFEFLALKIILKYKSCNLYAHAQLDVRKRKAQQQQ